MRADGDGREQRDVARVVAVRCAVGKHDPVDVFDDDAGSGDDRAPIGLGGLRREADLPVNQPCTDGVDQRRLDLLQTEHVGRIRRDRVDDRGRPGARTKQCRVSTRVEARADVRVGEDVPRDEAMHCATAP
jgi:hypothetical protein